MFVETHTSLLDRWYRLGTRIRCALEPDEPRLLVLQAQGRRKYR